MHTHTCTSGCLAAALAVALSTGAAQAQFAIDWYAHSTGGTTLPASGGIYTLQSSLATALSPGTVSAGTYVLSTGFLVAAGAGTAICYANCDGSTLPPILNVDDFTCFINSFASAQNLPLAQQIIHYSNCDHSTLPPVLNVDDFTCFINAFATGCP